MHVNPDDLLTIGDVVRRTGVSASALHFYERKGLIFSERGGANQRLYPRHMLRRISLIIMAKRLGIPLGDVAAVFSTLPGHRAPTHKDWLRPLSRGSSSWRSAAVRSKLWNTNSPDASDAAACR
ncbi:MerR family transcriptional regulator [Streptomyces rectiviolaceus]|uniref:MerR family transcriptional regulator n=1 Tax=Streptomyces rectiviolaceus TaxID=332591 RepID=UPI00363C28D6